MIGENEGVGIDILEVWRGCYCNLMLSKKTFYSWSYDSRVGDISGSIEYVSSYEIIERSDAVHPAKFCLFAGSTALKLAGVFSFMVQEILDHSSSF